MTLCLLPDLSFNSTTCAWVSNLGSHYETSIRVYDTAIVFSQTYVNGSSDTSVPTGDVLSAFPRIQAVDLPQPFGFVAFSGEMAGWYPVYGVWGSGRPTVGTEGTGPLILFSSDLQTSFVLSPASNFMAASQVCHKRPRRCLLCEGGEWWHHHLH